MARVLIALSLGFAFPTYLNIKNNRSEHLSIDIDCSVRVCIVLVIVFFALDHIRLKRSLLSTASMFCYFQLMLRYCIRRVLVNTIICWGELSVRWKRCVFQRSVRDELMSVYWW